MFCFVFFNFCCKFFSFVFFEFFMFISFFLMFVNFLILFFVLFIFFWDFWVIEFSCIWIDNICIFSEVMFLFLDFVVKWVWVNCVCKLVILFSKVVFFSVIWVCRALKFVCCSVRFWLRVSVCFLSFCSWLRVVRWLEWSWSCLVCR